MKIEEFEPEVLGLTRTKKRTQPKSILKERETAISLTSVDRRVQYLQTLITDAHNRVAFNPLMVTIDRTRYYNFISSAVKMIHDMQTSSSIEDLEERFDKLEDQFKKANGGKLP